MAKDDFGFEPIVDHDVGFEPDAAGKAALANYIDSESPGLLDSSVGGTQQGMSLNHADEAEAALKAGLERLSYGPDVSNPPSLADLYTQYRDANRKKFKQQEEQNPIAYTAGNFIGGAAVPLGTIGQLGKGAPMAAKMAEGALAGTVAGAINAEGAQSSPLLSDQTIPNMKQGAVLGAGIGAAIPPVISGAVKGGKKLYDAGKYLADVIGTPLGSNEFTGGFEQGLKGNDLSSSKAPLEIGGEIRDLSEKVPRQLIDKLNEYATLKKGLLDQAKAEGRKVDPEKVDAFLQKHLDFNPNTNEAKAHGEAESFKEMLRTASQGPEVEKVNRQFYSDGPSQEKKFLQQMKMTDAAEAMETAPISPRDEFERKANEKLAEQRALSDKDPVPFETHYEPIPDDPNHELAIVKQKQFDDQGNFQGYKSVMKKVLPVGSADDTLKSEIIFQDIGEPGKKMAIRRMPIKDDSGEITGYKVLNKKLINESDAAKFKDFTENVRSGNKDLTDPEQLLTLYKDLQNRSFGSMQSNFPEVAAQTRTARNDVQGLLRSLDTQEGPQGYPMTPIASPGEAPKSLGQTDARISALKDAASSIGLETQGQDLSSADINPELINKKITEMVKKIQSGDASSADIESQLKHFVNKVRLADPQMGHDIEEQINNLSSKYNQSGAAQKEIYSMHNLGAMRSAAAKVGNVVGYGIYNATPNSLMRTAQRLNASGSKASQQVAKVLSEAATKDDRTRNTILFGLMQNPAYRQILESQKPTSDEDIQMEPVK